VDVWDKNGGETSFWEDTPKEKKTTGKTTRGRTGARDKTTQGQAFEDLSGEGGNARNIRDQQGGGNEVVP